VEALGARGVDGARALLGELRAALDAGGRR
jgi:hypothetical protein